MTTMGTSHDIDILPVDETAIAQSIDFIVTNEKIYVALIEPSQDDRPIIIPGNMAFGKELLYVRGAKDRVGPFARLEDLVFFAHGQNEIATITQAEMKVKRINASLKHNGRLIEFDGITNNQIIDLASDNRYVYAHFVFMAKDALQLMIDSGVQQQLLMRADGTVSYIIAFDQNLSMKNIISSYETEILTPADTCIFIRKLGYTWESYRMGSRLRTLQLGDSSYLPEESGWEHERGYHGERWQTGETRYIKLDFSDGKNLYCLTSDSTILQVTDGKPKVIMSGSGAASGAMACNNGRYAAVAVNGFAYFIRDGELVGKVNLECESRFRNDICMDNKFFYHMGPEKIRRFAILDN